MSSKSTVGAQGAPDALKGRRQLGDADTFCFGCHRGLACFTRCCSDINILLTPVDVLRLARKLGLTTGQFLDTHALTPITKDLHLPVLMLRMSDGPERRCPFVGPEGCSVYEDRPWACRMYPVGMALPPARAGVEPQPLHYLFEDDFCEGRTVPTEWTVALWRENQGVRQREDLEAGYSALVSHPWFIGGRQLDPKRIEMFHMACYDLDAFRRFVFDSTFLSRFSLEDGLVDKLRTDDDVLLGFAFRWLRFAMFAEPTMTPRVTSERTP